MRLLVVKCPKVNIRIKIKSSTLFKNSIIRPITRSIICAKFRSKMTARENRVNGNDISSGRVILNRARDRVQFRVRVGSTEWREPFDVSEPVW